MRTITILVGGLALAACDAAVEPGDAWEVAPRGALPAGADGYAADLGITCAVETTYDDDGAARVHVELASARGDDVEVLRWGTAWDAEPEVFDVRDADGGVAFFGIRPFRDEPGPSDYVVLPARGTIEASYALSARHPVPSATEARVEHLAATIQVVVDGERRTLAHECGVGAATLQPQPIDDLGSVTQGITIHEDCTAEQRATLETTARIVNAAEWEARRLSNVPAGLYRRYFGTWTQDNANVVWSRFHSMADWEWDQEVRCFSETCGDHPTWNGYYDQVADRIYLCNWDRPVFDVRRPSISGTLIHEMSHDVGTDDVTDLVCGSNGAEGTCYGYPDDIALAQTEACVAGSSSCKALDNGDNYEIYGAEAYLAMIAPAIF